MTNADPVHDATATAAPAEAPLLKLEDFLPHRLNVLSSLGVGHTIQELLNPWVRILFQFVRRRCRNDVAFIENDNSIRDQERARQFVRDHDNRDSEGLLQIQNQLVDPCSDDGIKSR